MKASCNSLILMMCTITLGVQVLSRTPTLPNQRRMNILPLFWWILARNGLIITTWRKNTSIFLRGRIFSCFFPKWTLRLQRRSKKPLSFRTYVRENSRRGRPASLRRNRRWKKCWRTISLAKWAGGCLTPSPTTKTPSSHNQLLVRANCS